MKTLALIFAATLAPATLPAAAQAPNDAQIASIVVTANQVDIDAGRLAEKKGSNPEDLKKLGKLKGAAFDKAYIEHKVAYHEQVIDAINKTLIPNAKNPGLKKLLETGLPLFEGHLEHAKQIESSLGK